MSVPKLPIVSTLKNYSVGDLPHDLLGGIVVAALTIPIALGYAQVAGLPAIYGLYGSILPLIIFACMTTSPHLVVGMDAAGSAIMGSALIGASIAFGSPEAMAVVPLTAFFTCLWLVLFAFLKIGRLVSFVSMPVMSGFISGIALSIMASEFVQIAGVPGDPGEFIESISEIIGGAFAGEFVWPSVALGCVTLAILLLTKRFLPKFPMVPIVLVAAIIAGQFLDYGSWGVNTIGDLPSGLPLIHIPSISLPLVEQAFALSPMVAIVVAVESILADNNFSRKGGYRIDVNHEIASFGVMNLFSALAGASPASASVSRTAAAIQYRAHTQVSNIIAALCLIAVCLFLTPALSNLALPILAGIVCFALCGVVEFDVAARLRRVSRGEFIIFCLVLVSVLFVGIIFGVIMGVILSLFLLLRKALNPPRYFLGLDAHTGQVMPLRPGYTSQRIRNIVMYRFAGSLFFANCDVMEDEVERAITDETEAVFLDVSLIPSVDISAGDRMASLLTSITERGLNCYLVGISDVLSDQLASYEIGDIDVSYASTLQEALEASGVEPILVSPDRGVE